LLGVISVVEYDPAWPRRFEQLRREYAAAMAAAGVPVVAIEHVGSTSVPGLAAKPVIDCDIVVAERDVAAASRALTGLEFKPLGELGIPLRWAFKEPERLAGTNTYVVVPVRSRCATTSLSGTSCEPTQPCDSSTPRRRSGPAPPPRTSTNMAVPRTP
jgi:GrpB-like predicted nucleotidyltransferase (UPF0157 family)